MMKLTPGLVYCSCILWSRRTNIFVQFFEVKEKKRKERKRKIKFWTHWMLIIVAFHYLLSFILFDHSWALLKCYMAGYIMFCIKCCFIVFVGTFFFDNLFDTVHISYSLHYLEIDIFDLEPRYIEVKVEHNLLFMFSPPKISKAVSGIKYICLHLLPVFCLIQPSSKQIICFDFQKQNSVLPIVFYVPFLEPCLR